VVCHTLSVLRRCGEAHCEGLVLWVGRINDRQAFVEEVWVPRQRPIRSEHGVGYFVEAQALFELNQQLASAKVRLIAQVHSHPAEAYHSETDDAYAIVTTEGGLSLVVPNFGRAPANPAVWAVYRLVDAQWKELSREQATRLLQLASLE
jgi:hypothetical protein